MVSLYLSGMRLTELNGRTQNYVALKILRADCYGGDRDIFEQEVPSEISNMFRKSNHDNRHHVLPILDQFKHQGPNGEHVYLLFDVLGHHLDYQMAKFEDKRLPVKAVKIVAPQILLELDFLHRECGVIHTGMYSIKDHLSLSFESPCSH